MSSAQIQIRHLAMRSFMNTKNRSGDEVNGNLLECSNKVLMNMVFCGINNDII